MKIIAGELKGRIIKISTNLDARPTTSALKEAIFSILGSQSAIIGAKVLDLFSGTGALVFEAISRGAAYATAVDINRDSIRNLKENTKKLGLEEKVQTINCDVVRLRSDKKKYNLVFIDPPYNTKLIDVSINHLIGNNFLDNKAMLVCEFQKNHKFKIPNQLTEVFCRMYGKTTLQIFQYERKSNNDN